MTTPFRPEDPDVTPPSRRTERGQGSLEIVGVIVLAAILVLATVGTVVQNSPTIRGEVSYRICQVLSVAGGGDCDPPEPPRSPEDRLPDSPCVMGSTSASAKVGGAFLFVAGNTGRQFLVEELSDGSFRVTEVESGGLGVTAAAPGLEVGITLDGTKYGYGAMASAEALLAGRTGNTWYAEDEDALADLQESMMRGKIVDAVTPDKVLGLVPNPLNDLGKKIVGGEMPDPDETFIEGGIEGSAAASAENVVLGGGASVNVGTYLGGKKTPDGYSAYYRATASGNAYGTWLMLEGNVRGQVDQLVEIVMDSDGNPTSVRVTAGMSYGADVQITLQEDEREYTEVVAEVPFTGDPVEDAALLAKLSNPLTVDDFMAEARDNGSITRTVYEDDPNTYGLNVAGAYGGKLSLSASGDVTVRDLKSSQYWDGTTMAERPDC